MFLYNLCSTKTYLINGSTDILPVHLYFNLTIIKLGQVQHSDMYAKNITFHHRV